MFHFISPVDSFQFDEEMFTLSYDPIYTYSDNSRRAVECGQWSGWTKLNVAEKERERENISQKKIVWRRCWCIAYSIRHENTITFQFNFVESVSFSINTKLCSCSQSSYKLIDHKSVSFLQRGTVEAEEEKHRFSCESWFILCEWMIVSSCGIFVLWSSRIDSPAQ